jgi:hypothetical protein
MIGHELAICRFIRGTPGALYDLGVGPKSEWGKLAVATPVKVRFYRKVVVSRAVGVHPVGVHASACPGGLRPSQRHTLKRELQRTRPAAFAAWVQPLCDCAGVVSVEPPPTEQVQPEHVLKYLARYLTGGPIAG